MENRVRRNYKNAKFAIEDGGDFIQKPNSIFLGRYIADWTGNFKSLGSPFSQPFIELRCVARAGVYGCTQFSKFLNNRMPAHTLIQSSNPQSKNKKQKIKKKRGKIMEIPLEEELRTQFHECRRWREQSCQKETISNYYSLQPSPLPLFAFVTDRTEKYKN